MKLSKKISVKLTKREKILLINDHIKAVGIIGTDTSYEGMIKFYDINSNRLLYSSNYKNNILDGEQVTYYTNGKPRTIQKYSNGEINGYTSFYDSIGNLFSKQYSYYGIKAGHHINFYLNAPKEYGFYSLENELLFYINYDSLKKHKITELEESYFFYNARSFSNLSESEVNRKREFFLYLLNPPKFKFEYSIVQIDSNYNVITIDKVLDNAKIWSKFSINKESPDTISAVRLVIIDSSRNNEKNTMFKKL